MLGPFLTPTDTAADFIPKLDPTHLSEAMDDRPSTREHVELSSVTCGHSHAHMHIRIGAHTHTHTYADIHTYVRTHLGSMYYFHCTNTYMYLVGIFSF